MKFIRHFLLLFLLFPKSSFSQDQHLIDSLKNRLKQFEVHKSEMHGKTPEINDTVKANLLYELSKAYWFNNPEMAMEYANQSLQIAEEINFKKGIAFAYISIGIINYNQGNYQEALKYCNNSLLIANEINSKKGKILARLYIGCTYLVQGNYPVALQNIIASLKIAEEIKDKTGIAQAYSSLGYIYVIQGNSPEALKYDLAALKINEELGRKTGISGLLNNIAEIYRTQGNYDAALKYYAASLKTDLESGDKYSAAYNNIGVVYSAQGNYSEALKNYFIAIKISTELGDKAGLAEGFRNIGDVYTKLKNYKEAGKYLDDGLGLAKEIGDKEKIKINYESLAVMDSATGNWKSAYENHKLFMLYRDSLMNEENTKKTVQQQMQYDFDKKEAETKAGQEKKDAVALKEMQKQKLVRNGFVGGFAVVLLFAGVFFSQRNKITKGKKQSDELLLNILPHEVAEELKAKGSADAKQFDDVTVMFTDFKGFTQISEKLSPSELVAEIHTCFKAFDNIIGKNNIEKIKTIGDSYMCAGGLPVANTTNAIDVVKAAMEIQQFITEHLQQRKSAGKEPFEIRIGVHTGAVVAGIVGVKKFAYDIWGDTVNIASRMESSGEAGKVNISGSTYELVKDKFNCTHRGKIQAKNKGEIDMYFVEKVS